ncbi:MAG: prohibitin family protein [Nitrospinae bacterium]|nr:prohibitin family protein [Nitrospinota bacterium]
MKYVAIPVVAGVLLVFGLMFSPITTISSGHHGVVTVFGEVKDEVLTEGLHLVNPLARVIEIETRTRKLEVPGEGASKDLQTVGTHVAVNYRLNAASLSTFYKNIGMEYEERIMVPVIQESFKAITAKYTAEELITRRDEVKDQITANLAGKLTHSSGGGIGVDAISITNFKFSSAFNAAIEAKQVAEQDALKAKRELDKVKIEAEQKIANAKAEAESLRLQKQEITPDLIKLREIEVQRAAVEKWNGVLPVYTGSAMPFINLKQ